MNIKLVLSLLISFTTFSPTMTMNNAHRPEVHMWAFRRIVIELFEEQLAAAQAQNNGPLVAQVREQAEHMLQQEPDAQHVARLQQLIINAQPPVAMDVDHEPMAVE